MRRSRRKGQLRRMSSRCARSTRASRISSRSAEASASTTPCGSATKDEPQNSMPAPPGAVLVFLLRVPADGRGIKKQASARERGQARAFRIPLVPADERREAADAGVEGGEAEVARREVELLVVSGIVGDVDLAVESGEGVVGGQHRGAIVVEARGAAAG